MRVDRVICPDGTPRTYDWVESADQVRVAAMVDDRLLLIRQWHYLIGPSLQLPGGSVDSWGDAHAAARGELHQETGYVGGHWESWGYVNPLPGLSTVKVHLWRASRLRPGPPCPEPGEGDLTVVPLTLRQAYDAICAGEVVCAASAGLILRLCLASGDRRDRHVADPYHADLAGNLAL